MLVRMTTEPVMTIDEGLGHQLKRLRDKRGWTQQELARRIGEHGGSMHQTTILRTEKGERRVTLDEVVLLAAALNVPPPLLLLPLGSRSKVQITPNSQIHPHLALEWLRGDEPLVSTRRRGIDRAAWLEAAKPLDLWLRLRQVEDRVSTAHNAVRFAEYSGEEVGLSKARQEHASALTALHGHLREMQAAGELPPALPIEILEPMEAVGLDVDGFEKFEWADDWTLEELSEMQQQETPAGEQD